MAQDTASFQIKDSFFIKGKWLIVFWMCFTFVFSLYLSYPKIELMTYTAGFLIFFHALLLFTARKLLKVLKTINLIISTQIIISIIMGGLMIDNPTSSIAFLVSFLPIILIEEITFIDSKKLINIFSTSYIVILIVVGLINGDLKSEFYIIESIVLMLFSSKYYYSLIYNNYKKNIQLQQLNDELTAAYQEVTRLTTKKIKQELARDLHDSLVQDLIGIRLQLATIERQVQKKDFDGANQNFKNIQLLTQEAIIASRKKITEYRQMKSEDVKITLKAKVNEKTQLLKARYGLLTNLDIVDNLELPNSLLDDVVQIINEALVNVVRHAETSQAKVRAVIKGQKLIVKIINNGIPFPEKYQQQHDHYGLIGMRERAKSHDGDLKIWSTPEIGTIVLLEIPLRRERNV